MRCGRAAGNGVTHYRLRFALTIPSSSFLSLSHYCSCSRFVCAMALYIAMEQQRLLCYLRRIPSILHQRLLHGAAQNLNARTHYVRMRNVKRGALPRRAVRGTGRELVAEGRTRHIDHATAMGLLGRRFHLAATRLPKTPSPFAHRLTPLARTYTHPSGYGFERHDWNTALRRLAHTHLQTGRAAWLRVLFSALRWAANSIRAGVNSTFFHYTYHLL